MDSFRDLCFNSFVLKWWILFLRNLYTSRLWFTWRFVIESWLNANFSLQNASDGERPNVARSIAHAVPGLARVVRSRLRRHLHSTLSTSSLTLFFFFFLKKTKINQRLILTGGALQYFVFSAGKLKSFFFLLKN